MNYRTELLSHLVGFGGNTVGGLHGPEYWVTNLNDTGPGSLRDAISGTDEPRWVRFAVSGIITVSSAVLACGANKTIDGRDAYINIRSTSNLRGMEILNKGNVIVHNIEFGPCGTSGEPDCVIIAVDALGNYSAATDYWFDHCTFGLSRDEGISTYRCEPLMTMSWNKIRQTFPGHDMGCLIGGGSDDAAIDGAMVTMHHNWWSDMSERHPKIVKGKLHQFNDHIANWTNNGTVAAEGAQVLYERNIPEATLGGDTDAAGADTASCLKAVENFPLNGALIYERLPANVFIPPYAYAKHLDTATLALKERIKAGAGRRNEPTW